MDVELSVDLQSHLLDRPHFVAVIRLGGAALDTVGASLLSSCKPGSGPFCTGRGRHQQDRTGNEHQRCPNNATDSAGTCQHGTAAIRKLDGERKEKQERSQASQLPH